MRRRPFAPELLRRILRAGALLVLLLGARPAFAALGGDAASIAADQKHLLANARIVRAASYIMHELEAPTGTKVREYLDNAGKVFAVSWQGAFRPNLRQLLGSYYETFLAAARVRPVRGPLNLSLPGLVIHMSGHQRGFYGRAYLTDGVPQGLSLEEIR